MDTLEALASVLPVTVPIPSPVTNTSLLSPSDISREEDLLRNPGSFQSWWSAIQAVKEHAIASQKSQLKSLNDAHDVLGPLASPIARTNLQRLTYLFESALVHFPRSFKLWKAYLQMRCFYVLGKGTKPKRAGARKKYAEMREAMEDEGIEQEIYDGGLDGALGWEEWKALAGTFERALTWLPTMPRLWLLYLSIFTHPRCPPALSRTHARRTYDRALRTLPPSLHTRIWPRYLRWAEHAGGPTTVHVFRRYLAADPSLTEHYTSLLLAEDNPQPRPLEAAKLLLKLARSAARGEYVSPEGKSAYQLLGEWLDVVEAYAEDVGLDPDSIPQKPAQTDTEAPKQDSSVPEPVSSTGTLVRLAGPMQPATGTTATDKDKDAPAPRPYNKDEDPTNTDKLDIEEIIKTDGLAVYKDQAGRLWTGLATYWIKRGEFDRATATFEAGLASVLTIRDFTQIFDAYAEFSETLISALMDEVANPDPDEDNTETETELDTRMREFEALMDRRPFLVNDVLLRRNPNDVQEWEKRVALWGANDEKVAETYTTALKTINPKKTTANAHQLYVHFAKFYETGGVEGTSEPDLTSARRVLESATKIQFKSVDELAEVWVEWSDMEIRNGNFDEAVRVMQRATAVPRNVKISYHDQSLPVQARLFKSLKLWSCYVDLEEAIGTVETTKAVYDKMMELKIANAQVIVNYASFLEDNDYFEDSFKVYERGVELFTFPIAFEIWNIYLAKFIKRYGGTKLERARDLFEQALEKCPQKHCKSLFLMYAQLEEEHGLAKRAMDIYDRATQVVADQDKFEMFTIYIAKASANFGLPATRPIYERALQVLPNKQTAEMCLRFAQLERKLGEIDRARAIFAHASQFCDPRVAPEFWKAWNTFEIETGSEDTFREMLRIKRSVQAQYNTEVSFLAAQASMAREGGAKKAAAAAALAVESSDAMAAVENEAKKSGPAFVAAKSNGSAGADKPAAENGDTANADEIQIDDDDF
ncbi:pre-mRNA-splicing factor syf1 [Ceratobasidium sp. 395]|nr:pre-mRNA-splicing factor syf1 [Ceratobasidium sp. 395]